jgi:hypothetical protein
VRAALLLLALCAAPAFATFDTFDTDSVATAGITFSGGNLTALGASGTGLTSSSIAQSIEGKTAGKWYVEFTCVAISGNVDGVGLVSSEGINSSNGFLGSDPVNLGWAAYTNSHITNGNATVTSVNQFTYGAGDVIGVAIDLDNKRLWFNKNGSGTWVGTSGTPNPATNTSGFDLTNLIAVGRAYPAANLSGALAKFTANFGATSFTGTVPSGFTGGWTNTTAGTYFGTFATTGHGGAVVSAPPANDKAVSKYTATLSGSVTSVIFAFNQAAGGASSTKGVIYADSAGAPGALLGVSTNTVSGLGEQILTFSGVTVTSGTSYWFGMSNVTGNSGIYSPPQTNGVQFNTGPVASPTNPFGASPSTANWRYPAIINVAPPTPSSHHRLLFSRLIVNPR